MKAIVKRFLGQCDSSVKNINRLIVTSYLLAKGLKVDEGSMLIPYIIHRNEDGWEDVVKLCDIFNKHYLDLNLETLIDCFEFVVSPSDKIVTGAIYTPQYIRRSIVDYVFQSLDNRDVASLSIADIACGCGGFFLTVCEKILSVSELDCHYIYANILHGCDIEDYCIERSKILLGIKALERGERTDDLVFNFYIGNSLSFNWSGVIRNFRGFDAVVGNPPYVTSSKMPEASRELLKNWEVCSTGKADLYIPFFQIATELLNERGVLGYITVSNFYRSLNGKALRNYFANHELNLTIVDFGGEQVFKGCSTYTCLCFVDKQLEGTVKYVKTCSSSVKDVRDLHFVVAKYDDLNHSKGWVIRECGIDEVLLQIEKTGVPLGEVASISNGIATLKNDIYVLNIVSETEDAFIHEYEGVQYPIERSICRPVVKPSTMDMSFSIEMQLGWIIYPYNVSGRNTICYDENQMRQLFPKTLAYLKAVRPVLDERDKGNREYDQWYAYGRSQAINMPGKRLLMPYIADRPTFFLSDIEGLLYYNGFALISGDLQKLERLQKILNTDIFWFYIKNVSKPYANGYYSMGKRYIRYFGIPDLTEEQMTRLETLTERVEIEEMLFECYFGSDANEKKKLIYGSISD